MKNLFAYADKYLQKSNWKDMALLKFCLFSTGILVGMQVPDKENGNFGGPCFYRYLHPSDDEIYQGCDGGGSLKKDRENRQAKHRQAKHRVI